jgi:hypothetical protein
MARAPRCLVAAVLAAGGLALAASPAAGALVRIDRSPAPSAIEVTLDLSLPAIRLPLVSTPEVRLPPVTVSVDPSAEAPAGPPIAVRLDAVPAPSLGPAPVSAPSPVSVATPPVAPLPSPGESAAPTAAAPTPVAPHRAAPAPSGSPPVATAPATRTPAASLRPLGVPGAADAPPPSSDAPAKAAPGAPVALEPAADATTAAPETAAAAAPAPAERPVRVDAAPAVSLDAIRAPVYAVVDTGPWAAILAGALAAGLIVLAALVASGSRSAGGAGRTAALSRALSGGVPEIVSALFAGAGGVAAGLLLLRLIGI